MRRISPDEITYFVSRSERGRSTDEICRQLNVANSVIADILSDLKESYTLISLAGQWISPAGLESAQKLFLAELDRLHRVHPGLPTLPIQEVADSLDFGWPLRSYVRLAERLDQARWARLIGTRVAAFEHRASLTDKQTQLIQRFADSVKQRGYICTTRDDAPDDLGIPPQGANTIVQLAIEQGDVVEVAPDQIYASEELTQLVISIREKFSATGFGVGDFKTLTGTSRRDAIPLLEWLDRYGFTARNEDGIRRVL